MIFLEIIRVLFFFVLVGILLVLVKSIGGDE